MSNNLIRGLSGNYLAIFNISRTGYGLDVTWQPVRGDLTVPSVNSHSPVGLVSQQ